MPLKKIERNVHKAYNTWVLENISESLSKVVPLRERSRLPKTRRFDDTVRETHYFSLEFNDHVIEWYVTLKFNNNEFSCGFSIVFDAVEKLKPKNHVTCNFYLVDADKNNFFLGRRNRKFDSTHFYRPEIDHAFSRGQELPNTIDKLLPNDTLTLRIELITYLDDNPIFPCERIQYSIEPVVNLDDFLKLYKLQDDGDVMIYVQDVKFPVYKKVLEARCYKLYEMVDHNQQLTLMDIDPEIFKRVLEFIYTGKVEDLDDHSEYLLEAASKYQLQGLRCMCEISLVNNYLTYENSKEVRRLASRSKSFFLEANVSNLRNSIADYASTPSGTLITTIVSGEKWTTENHFPNGIPEGIKIIPE
ncbi:speckle-type POZ protein-like [Microplitis mediator]|uniref:speckle-type POZ protein-like n=1 Tax=Microplitis mediator TaxID=375433 RepID=UPI002552E738|nr:speckle-type POZ protein-like [Microplitis mediator]